MPSKCGFLCARIPRSPFEQGHERPAASDKTPKRQFTIPSTTILPLQHPSLGTSRFRYVDVLAHQARKSTLILARKPIAELPEDGAVHSGKEGRRVVGVLVEVRPSRKLPVQAFHKVH